MAVSFSRKPAYSAPSLVSDGSDAGDLRARILAAAANPFIGASAAAFLFLLSLALLVLVTGDPNKGSPLVRVALDQIGTTQNVPPGWREALVGEGEQEAPLLPGALDLSNLPFPATARPTTPRPARSPPRRPSPRPTARCPPRRSPASTPRAPAAARCR
jgi:hypothetical protein